MTLEDVEFMKEQQDKIDYCPNPINCADCPDRRRFLSLLLESEAMRDKAEYLREFEKADRGDVRILDHFFDKWGEKIGYTNAQWIAAKKKEWRI